MYSILICCKKDSTNQSLVIWSRIIQTRSPPLNKQLPQVSALNEAYKQNYFSILYPFLLCIRKTHRRENRHSCFLFFQYEINWDLQVLLTKNVNRPWVRYKLFLYLIYFPPSQQSFLCYSHRKMKIFLSYYS